jgi:molybdate transport system substrate-binding protein
VRRRIARGVVAMVVASIGLVGASGAAHAAKGTQATRKQAKMVSGTITVSAAASLTDAFRNLGADFEQRHPGTTVTFNFAGSSALVQQIQGGAPADVFASADGANMQKVVTGGDVTAEPTVFATNVLTIVVKPGNPRHVKSLADLAHLSVVSLCAPAVPCGNYADQILSQADVTIPTGRITRGADVKSTLSAVSAGDADAAIVYSTDATAARDTVESVSIPAWQNAYAIYPIAPIAASSNRDLANAWIRYTVSRAGQRTLRRYGFLPPPST